MLSHNADVDLHANFPKTMEVGVRWRIMALKGHYLLSYFRFLLVEFYSKLFLQNSSSLTYTTPCNTYWFFDGLSRCLTMVLIN